MELGKSAANTNLLITLRDYNDQEISNPNTLSETFNEFFLNIITIINGPQATVTCIHDSFKTIRKERGGLYIRINT